MCGKSHSGAGRGERGGRGGRGGFGELLFLDTNRKLVRVGGRRLMRKHKCNTMLMSVFLCGRVSPRLTAALRAKGRLYAGGKRTRTAEEISGRRPGGFYSRKGHPRFTSGHTKRLELSPRYKEILECLPLQPVIGKY